MTDNRVPAKRPPLSTRHKSLGVEWAGTYLKQDMQHVNLSDETSANHDVSDIGAKG